MAQTHLQMNHVARIEGHGNVSLSIDDGRVVDVRMNIVEPARMFESMVVGRPYDQLGYIASRICGICSSSHVVTSLLAVEQIFGIEVSERTRQLRELLVYGSFLQNHTTHLLTFAAPDYLGMESMLPLSESDPGLYRSALSIKQLGNDLCTAIGGRAIHPVCAVVGGFTHEPDPDLCLVLADRLRDVRPAAEKLVSLFAGFDVPSVITDGDMLSLSSEGEYPVFDADARFASDGERFSSLDYHRFIEEYPVDYSAAYLSRRADTGSSFMVGALARMNAGWDGLSQPAHFAAVSAGLRPYCGNPYMNNIAQAVELVDACVRCEAVLRELSRGIGSSEPVRFVPKAGRGVGMTEAPRGLLVHDIELDEDGRVVHASIITPTVHNLREMEANIWKVAEVLLESGASDDDIRHEVEMLVRAYDPCLSCSVH